MDKILFIILVIAISLVGCKTSKTGKRPASAYQSAVNNTNEMVVDSSPKTEVEAIKNANPSNNESQIVTRSENVNVAKGEDQTQNNFKFYVIVGSFSSDENAHKLKDLLQSKGFSPVIMQNENGMYRVSIKQTNVETEARETIGEIRSNLPDYKDVWLLKKN